MAKRIITEADILAATERGDKSLAVPSAECIVTAQARDKALEHGVSLDEGAAECEPCAAMAAAGAPAASEGAAPDLENVVAKVMAGMHDVLPKDADASMVTRLVRDAVAARLGARGAGSAEGGMPQATSGIIFIDSAGLLAKTGTAAIREQAVLAEAIGRPGESRLAAGYLLWEGMSFERTVDVPELIVVIEGELHLKYDGKTSVARPGDMAYLPEGSRVAFDAPSRVKVACINTLA
jgi:ethanolamine utilization protein EutQ